METIILEFNTFEEAMDIHKQMFIKLQQNGSISFKELGELMYPGEGWTGIEIDYFEKNAEKYGWNNLQDSDVTVNDVESWHLVLPQPVQIK